MGCDCAFFGHNLSLEEDIKNMSIKVKSARAKGIAYENFLSDKIVERGLDSKCHRDGASGAGTREKADINTSVEIFGRTLGIEAKCHEKLAIPDWWKQVEKLETLGREPVLAFKIPNRNPRVDVVCIYLDTFLDMVQALKGVDDVASNVVENYNYDKVQHLNSLIYMKESLNRAIRQYNKKILKEE